MLTLQKEITVKAPISKVFEYMAEPMHLPEIWPSLYEVKEVESFPTGGHSFDWFYNMAGKRFTGTTKTFEWYPNEKIVEKMTGDIESTYAWKFFGDNGTTKVQLTAEYETPKFFENKDLPFLVRRNELEADTLLENLKARFES